MRPGLYEARSLIGEKKTAYVLVEEGRTRMEVALRMIRDQPRSREVAKWAEWALRDAGEGA